MIPDPIEFRFSRQVASRDTDQSGFVHFANYVRYMEETEYAFLRSRGLSIVLHDQRGTIGFPRRSTEFSIDTPARIDDQLDIILRLSQMDGVSLEYDFEIECGPDRIGAGHFQVVCCRFPDNDAPYAILFPEFVMERLAGHFSDGGC